MKYYYRHKDTNLYLIKKQRVELEDYVEITEEQYKTETALDVVCQPVDIEKLTEIENLKRQLNETDYQAIKYAEGWLTEEEYAPIKEYRQSLRNQINELESN